MSKLFSRPSVTDITGGVIWKQLLVFFFPILLGTFFQQLYNTVDAVIVGKVVGKEALAAVGGPSGVIINLLVGFFVGLSSGATVILSQHYGARQDKEGSRTVHTAIALSVAGGAILTVGGFLLAPWALSIINTPTDVLVPSVIYLRIYFLGMIPSLIYNMGSGILRAVGDSQRPLYFLIAGCITNIVLDLLFVLVLDMGVTGAAVATVLSQLVSALLVVITLMRTNETYRLVIGQIGFHGKLLLNIVKIGLPAGLQSVMYGFSNIIIQSNINTFDTDAVAAFTAFGKIDAIFWMIIGAYGVSITTFVGQNFGAKKYDRIYRSSAVCLAMAAFTTVFITTVICAFDKYLLHLFTDDPAVVAHGEEMIRLVAPFWIAYISIEIFAGAVRGTGDSLIPMIMTCFGICALRIVWLYAFVPRFNTIDSVLFSYPMTWIVTSTLFILYYFHGGWLRRRRAAMGDPVIRGEKLHIFRHFFAFPTKTH